jgi:MoxR-like ATPase
VSAVPDYKSYLHETRDCWEDLRAALAHGRNVLAFGPPGVGKTLAVWQHAYDLVGDKAEMVTLDPDTTRFSLLYQMLPPDFKVTPGPGLRAWEGGILILNELDRVGEGSAETALHLLLDDQKAAILKMDDGREFRPHSGFRCFATMNGTPDQLPHALVDRFQAIILVDTPNPAAIAAIKSNRLRKLAKAMFKDDPANWPTTNRTLRDVDLYVQNGVTMEQAFRIAIPDVVKLRNVMDAYAAQV